jgi:hypothetical protein
MSLREIYRNLGIEPALEEEKKRFVQRINQSLFPEITEDSYASEIELFRHVCYQLGRNPSDEMLKYNRLGNEIPPLRRLTKDDFQITLEVVCHVYSFFPSKNRRLLAKIDACVTRALDHAIIDLGIRWKDGLFYRSGGKLLDEKLVEDPLDWIKDFPDERKDFALALKNFYANDPDKLKNVPGDCYNVVEGLARTLLSNTKVLRGNKEELLKALGLSKSWGSMLSNYIDYADEFRHASENRGDIDRVEVEAFVYLTGLLARLIIEKMVGKTGGEPQAGGDSSTQK